MCKWITVSLFVKMYLLGHEKFCNLTAFLTWFPKTRHTASTDELWEAYDSRVLWEIHNLDRSGIQKWKQLQQL